MTPKERERILKPFKKYIMKRLIPDDFVDYSGTPYLTRIGEIRLREFIKKKNIERIEKEKKEA